MNNNYISKIYFNLPGCFEKKWLLQLFINYCDNHKIVTKNNIVIHSVYGSPCCIWNGGRPVYPNVFYSEQELLEIRDYYNNQNISIRFTFTNSELKEEHIKDFYGNLLLELFANGKNEIICYSPILESYIRNKYGKLYKYIASTTKKLMLNEQETELSKYDFVCLNYDLNKNFNLLNSIKEPNKIELLANPVCFANCKKSKDHYKQVSLIQLAINEKNFDLLKQRIEESHQKFPCEEQFLFEQQQLPNFLSIEELNSFYLPNNFNMIKLEGRSTLDLNFIDILIYFLIKNEYQNRVRKDLQVLYMQNIFKFMEEANNNARL